jgi:hypothetical protein
MFPTAKELEQISRYRDMTGYRDKLRETANLFTISKIAVYPVGAEGLMMEQIYDASSSGRGSSGTGGQTTMDPYMAGASQRADTISAMERIATSTGGKAYYNTNDLNGAMQRAIHDGANYYTIAYAPTSKKMDGSYRQIDVRLTSGRYKLAYRRGYNADNVPAPDAKGAHDPLAPLLHYGLPAASGVLFGAQATVTNQKSPDGKTAGENSALKGPVARHVVEFIIRAGDVTWQTTANGNRSCRILVGLKAYDRDGNAVNWQGGVETIEVSATEYGSLQKKGIQAHLEIDLPHGDFRLVTAVYDWNSGKAGTLELPVQPRVE